MNKFMILLVFGFAVSDKLDRNYLPPPGALLAGGSPGDIQAPLEPPHSTQRDSINILPKGKEGLIPSGYSAITPVTTTSYAFTQTTTFPSVESYESTTVPINFVTGLPVQNQYSKDGNINYVSFGNQPENQYMSQNSVITGAEPGISGSQYQSPQDFKLNNKDQFFPSQQIFLPSASTKDTTSSEQLPQTSYFGQPINVQDVTQYVPNQDYQYSTPNNYNFNPNEITGANNYQPMQIFDSVSSTTPTTGFPSSTSAYNSIGSVNRSDRPQAETDRNAVIINYENVRTPTGYFYSYDTSNGIHADESGSVGNGTKAQGSYSYIGDDGKIYSVIYTADENGFQPRGDHLPTPPPIPQAIKEVIEQAARDKEAGIIDDGSYDEAKYGYKKYQRPVNYRRPQIQQLDNLNMSIRIPTKGNAESDYDENVLAKQFNKNVVIDENKNQQPHMKQSMERPLNEISDADYAKSIIEKNQQTFIGSEYDKDVKKILLYPGESYDDEYKNITSHYSGVKPETTAFPIYKNKSEFYDNKDNILGSYKLDQIYSTTKSMDEPRGKGTTLRPFLTPEVYNQPSFKGRDTYLQPTTQKPFMTSQVTPKDSSYMYYDNGKEYTSVQDFDEESSFRDPEENISDNTTRRPFEYSPTTSKSQYTLNGQRMHISDKETVTPDYEDTAIKSTRRPLILNSQFGNMNTMPLTKPRNQYRPNYSTDIGKQVSLQYIPAAQKSLYQDQPGSTRGPVSTYPGKIGAFDKAQPTYDSVLPLEPVQFGSGIMIPSKTYTSTQNNLFSPGYYQTTSTFEQNPDFTSSPKTKPSTSVESSSIIVSQPRTSLPESQRSSNQYGIGIPDYTVTIMPPKNAGTYSGTKLSQTPSLGYIYEPPRISTLTPTTIGTTSRYPASSTVPGLLFQEYSTTQQPIYPSAQNIYEQNLVDGFGRPITSQAGFSYVGQKPILSSGPQLVREQGSGRPRGQDQPKVIGEDFSGPKQSQGFDSETGYKYK